MLERKIKRERREWLERVKQEEKRVEAKKRREALLNSYERDVVVPKEIRHKIKEEEITAEEAMSEAIYAHEQDEKEDEYSAMEEARVVITTSRSPSQALVKFAKSLKYIIPGSEKINRGKHQIEELVKMSVENGHTDLIMVNEHKGRPSSAIISHLPYGPTAYFSVHNVDMTGDLQYSTGVPGVVFDNLTTPLGIRIKRILSSLFPPAKKERTRFKPKRIVSFANREDFIIFQQFSLSTAGGSIALEKLAPTFSLKLYEIRSGTLDMDYADKEYVFRPYLNTARKKLYLGEEVVMPEEE